jgi:predicted dehydrogenase
MSGKLRTVLAGCGRISQTWLRAVSEMSDIEIVGLVDLNEDAARHHQSDFSLPDAVVSTDLKTVLDQVRPDAVFDCTLPESHFPVTLTALEHGCHVLGEKPLADTMENARKMVDAAKKAGKIYAVVQNRRYQPEIRALTELLASGRLGRLTTLNCDFYIGAHFGGFRERMKHVLLLDMAIHTFDAARLISGADPVSVYCHEWNPEGSWYDHDASAIAIFEMSNGVVYTYRGSWCSEGLNTTWESNWHAICAAGSAKWDGATDLRAQAVSERGAFFSEMEDIAVQIPKGAKSGGHAGVIREFVDCVRNGRTPETVCTDNIKSLAMVFAAIESAEKGAPVNVAR